MTQVHQASVLIVDRSEDWAADLRSRLAPLGVKVHVVNSETSALMLARSKKIDVAVLEFSVDPWTTNLCRELHELNVSTIYTATPADARSEGLGAAA